MIRLIKNRRIRGVMLLLLCFALQGCDDNTAEKKPEPSASNSLELPPLPVNAPALGTKIQTLVTSSTIPEGEFTEIAWENLELPGQGMAEVMKRYESVLRSTEEGAPEEDKLLEKMQAELNSSPVNPALNDKKIKIPGFVTPLDVDDNSGQITTFLLVPYFGACLHVPPPPLNQTLLVKPVAGKSISVDAIYEPVWVYGTLKADTVTTALAQAGYQILDARVEPYTETPPSGAPTEPKLKELD